MSPIEIAWTVVGIIAPLSVGLGYAAVGLAPPDFRFAKGCFWFSVLLLGVMDVVWSIGTEHSIFWRVVVSGLIGAVIFILLPEGLRFVARREFPNRLVAPPQPGPVPAARLTKPEPEPTLVTKPEPPRADHPKPKPEPPPAIAIAPSFGNLQGRALELANDLDVFVQQRKDQFLKIPSPQPQQDVETWAYSTDGVFRIKYWNRVMSVHDDFAKLNFRDEGLDETISDYSRSLQERTPRREEEKLTHYIDIPEIQSIAERLRVLATQLPK